MSSYVRETLPTNELLRTAPGDVCGYIAEVTVTFIDDGDTIKISSTDGLTNNRTIRFIGVDTPEYVISREQYDEYANSDIEEQKYKVNGIKEHSAYNSISINDSIKAGQRATEFTKSCISVDDKIMIVFSVKKYKGDRPTEYITDTYNRLLGEIYFKDVTGYYVNLNKTLLLNGHGEVTSFPNTYTETTGWTNYLPVHTADFRKLDEESAVIPDQIVAPGLYGQYYDNSIDLEYMDVERPIEELLAPGYTRIGDVELVIPPLALSVIQQSKGTSVKTIRSLGSIQKTSGYVDKIIQLELFFSSANAVNGYKVEDDYGNTYYINGLRPLIAQFKKAPFVPIQNEHINFNHFIDAVALKSINARTVDGFPTCVAVTLTLLAFDTAPFLCFTDCLDGAINWPLFRWYYQRPMYDPTSIHYISEIPKTGMRNDISFGLPNEDSLDNLKIRLKLLNDFIYHTDYSDKNSLFGQINQDLKALEKIKNYEIEKERWRKDDNLTRELGREIALKAISNIEITKEYEAINNKKYFIKDTNNIYITITPEDCDLIDAIILNCNKTIDGREKLEQEKERKAKNLSFSEEDIMMDYFAIPNLIPVKINAGMENVFSSAQVQNIESSSLQYLGSQDAYASISFVGDYFAVTQLSDYIRTCARYAREYRIGVNTGFLAIENDFLNLFGIREVTVESCIINNIENTDMFSIELVLIAFNKRQKRSEKISSYNTMSNNKYIKDISDLVELYQIYDAVPETKMLTMELYPDLELPTYIELFKFCNTIGIAYPLNNYYCSVETEPWRLKAGEITIEEASELTGGKGYDILNTATYEDELKTLRLYLKEGYHMPWEKKGMEKRVKELEELVVRGQEREGAIDWDAIKKFKTLDYNPTVKRLLPVYVDPDFYICTPETVRNELKKKAESILSNKNHKMYFSSVADLEAASASFPNPSDDEKPLEEYIMFDNIGDGERDYAQKIDEKYKEKLGPEAMQQIRDNNPKEDEIETSNQTTGTTIENNGRATEENNEDLWKDIKESVNTPEGISTIVPGGVPVKNSSSTFSADFQNKIREKVETKTETTTSSNVKEEAYVANKFATSIPADFGSTKVTPEDMKHYDTARNKLIVKPEITKWAEWKNQTVEKVAANYEAECGVNPKYENILHSIFWAETMTNIAKGANPNQLPIKTELFVTYVKALIYQESTWAQFIEYEGKMIPNIGNTPDIGLGQLVPEKCNLDEDMSMRAAWDWRYNIFATCYKYGHNVEYARSHYIKNNIDWQSVGEIQWHEKNILMWAMAVYNMGTYNSKKNLYASFKGDEWKDFNSYYTSSVETHLKKPFCTNLNKVPDGTAVNVGDWYSSLKYDIPNTVDSPEYDMKWTDYPSLEAEFSPHENLIGRIHDMTSYDQRGRLIRAFPTFCMLLIDEGIWITWIKLWDNFYGLSGVNSIDVVKSRKNPVDTCVISLSNVYGMLSNFQKYENSDSGYTRKFNISELLFNEIDTASIVEARKKDLDSLMLKTGARIHLRLGYGSCANNLPIVFNGTITEIGSGEDLIEIVAQGDGIELTNPVPAMPGDTNKGNEMAREPRNTLLHFMTGDQGWWRRTVEEILTPEEGEDPGFLAKHIPRPDNECGVVHFGRPFDKFSNYVGHFNFNELGEVSLGELAINIYSTNQKGTHSQNVYDEYCQNKLSGDPADETMNKLKKTWPWELDEPNILVNLFGQSIWDLAHLFSLTVPDYITSVVPFSFRSTLFFGKPYWNLFYDEDIYYEYNEKTKSYNRITSRYLYKPFQQHHMYFSEIDIINNGIIASEEGIYTNVQVKFTDKDGKRDTTKTIHTDTDIYPEKQRTAIHEINMIDAAFFFDNWRETSAMKMAYTAGAQILKDYMKDMYKGSLLILGDPAIKPLDTFHIADTTYDMSGMAGVKQVVHHFSHETGFVTSIAPDTMVFVDDKYYLDSCIKLGGVTNIIASSIIGFSIGRLLFKKRLYPMFMIGKDATGTAWIKVAEAYNKVTGEKKEFKELLKMSQEGLSELYLKAKDTKALKVSEQVVTDTIKALETVKDDKFLLRVGKWAGRVGYKVPKGLFKAGKTLAKGAAIIGAGLAGATVAIPGIILAVATSIITDSLFTAYSRFKQNRQAVIIMPLKSYGHDLLAGVKGHQGCVVGDTPSKIDEFYEGKNGGVTGVIVQFLNFMSGDTNTYSYKDSED